RTCGIMRTDDFKVDRDSMVIVMPKPLYAYPIIKIVNEGKNASGLELTERFERPDLNGIKALVVDDEPMNLVVATGLFKDYGIITDTANSGKQAIEKCMAEKYDVIFMDHMMPEMDGVEAMKMIRARRMATDQNAAFIALTANVVSGAKEMFMREGFDGFVGKPINTNEFERVMARLLPKIRVSRGGDGI
ncbi:MAG: response regulator, partial [Paludibacteraceae bacterium]|nr:response regulator [Paludibacteraceae bacterium]